MAFVIADRVRETSTTTGAGNFTLAGAVSGYQTFDAVLDTGDTTYYTIADQSGANWEVGIGTFTSPSTLARTTILSSSNGGSIVTFTAGTKDVFISLPASKTNTNDQPNVIAVNSTTNALRITQTGTGNALVVEDSTNPDATPFVVEANGRLIVGHTATVPSVGVSSTPQIGVFSNSTTNNGFANYSYTASTGASSFSFAKSRSVTSGTPSIVLFNDDLGYIRFNGDDGTQFVEAARIWAEVDGTPGVDDMPGRLVFSTTADGASTPTERMRIDNAGRIGIGGPPSSSYRIMLTGQNPDTPTDVGFSNRTQIKNGTTSSFLYHTAATTEAAAFTLTNLTQFYVNGVSVGAGSSVTNQYGFRAHSSLTTATNNYGFYSDIASGTGRWNFYANGTADNYFAGKVGIGTSSPGSALDVKGTLRLSGATSGYVGLAPAAAAGSTTYTLPAADGSSGQVLSTNGSGTLSWASATATGTLKKVQVFTSSGTYTRTAGVTTAVVIAVGGGGGGAGSNDFSSGGNGGNGGTTSFGAHVTALGGTGCTGTTGGAGGTGGTGATLAIKGQGGGGSFAYAAFIPSPRSVSGIGGGQGGGAGVRNDAAGNAGVRGGGGSGGAGSDNNPCSPGAYAGGGGGQGETCIKYTTTVGATETVTIGAGGTAGTGSKAGGAGGAGYIIVYEYS